MLTDEQLEQIACDIVGTCDFNDPLSSQIEEALGRAYTEEEKAQAEEYLAQEGVQPCDSCGWWQSDNEGNDANLCWRCAEDEANDEDFDLEEDE